MIALAIIMGLTASVACHKDVPASVPDELVGTWITDEPVYRDRSMKLEKEYIIIGFGEDGTPTAQRVTKVETIKNEAGMICTIYSGDQEGQHQLTVYFDRSDGGSIYFRNVRGKWRKR
jgi:hypothetical protein